MHLIILSLFEYLRDCHAMCCETDIKKFGHASAKGGVGACP